jgi:hypothetical protein
MFRTGGRVPNRREPSRDYLRLDLLLGILVISPIPATVNQAGTTAQAEPEGVARHTRAPAALNPV